MAAVALDADGRDRVKLVIDQHHVSAARTGRVHGPIGRQPRVAGDAPGRAQRTPLLVDGLAAGLAVASGDERWQRREVNFHVRAGGSLNEGQRENRCAPKWDATELSDGVIGGLFCAHCENRFKPLGEAFQ